VTLFPFFLAVNLCILFLIFFFFIFEFCDPFTPPQNRQLSIPPPLHSIAHRFLLFYWLSSLSRPTRDVFFLAVVVYFRAHFWPRFLDFPLQSDPFLEPGSCPVLSRRGVARVSFSFVVYLRVASTPFPPPPFFFLSQFAYYSTL